MRYTRIQFFDRLSTSSCFNKMMRMILISIMAASARALLRCENIPYKDMLSDLGVLADAVSWDGVYHVDAPSGRAFDVSYESEGVFDTRMRVYDWEDTSVFVFRPTQQTPAGGDIHVDRRLVPATFISNGTGMVHERFQMAFSSLTDALDISRYSNRTVMMCSHSLGGALDLFMHVYLQHEHGITPALVMSLAGPFIGDEEFTKAHVSELGGYWMHMEVVDESNPNAVDRTVEGYNVDQPPYIFVDMNHVCGLWARIAEPSNLHLIQNYQAGLNQLSTS